MPLQKSLTSDTHPPTCSAFPKLPTPPPAKDARTTNKISKLVVFLLFKIWPICGCQQHLPAPLKSGVRHQLAPWPWQLPPSPAPSFCTLPSHPRLSLPYAGPQCQLCSSWPGWFRCHGRRGDGSGWGGEDFRTRHTGSDGNELPGGRDLCQGRPDMTRLSKGPGPLRHQLHWPLSSPSVPICPPGLSSVLRALYSSTIAQKTPV